jgi:hypothetical protein
MNITVNTYNEVQSKHLSESLMYSNNYLRYILGRNKYTAQFINMEGFID